METVDGSAQRFQDHDDPQPRKVLWVAIGIGLLSGVGAGFVVGVAVTQKLSLGPAIGIGVAAGVGAWILGTLTAFVSIHALLARWAG